MYRIIALCGITKHKTHTANFNIRHGPRSNSYALTHMAESPSESCTVHNGLKPASLRTC